MFGGNADVLKHSLQINGANYEIVGVMPPQFEYPFKTDLPYGDSHIQSTKIWVPLALTPKQKANRDVADNVAIARLRPGVSIPQAEAEMSTMMAHFDRLYPSEYGDWGALVESFIGISIGPVRPMMELLLATVLLVLLIACANTTNLLLARATGRTRELGVRAALGAGRGRSRGHPPHFYIPPAFAASRSRKYSKAQRIHDRSERLARRTNRIHRYQRTEQCASRINGLPHPPYRVSKNA
jgi:putative ABC transport system permease protein